jgi:hypothetical protein
VSKEEIGIAISRLESGKSCGMDGVSAEHLKYCSDIVLDLLALCFTKMFVHGFIPDSMLVVILVPIVKDKSGKLASKDNYRPVALASLISKVLEIVIFKRLENYIETCSN